MLVNVLGSIGITLLFQKRINTFSYLMKFIFSKVYNHVYLQTTFEYKEY